MVENSRGMKDSSVIAMGSIFKIHTGSKKNLLSTCAIITYAEY